MRNRDLDGLAGAFEYSAYDEALAQCCSKASFPIEEAIAQRCCDSAEFRLPFWCTERCGDNYVSEVILIYTMVFARQVRELKHSAEYLDAKRAGNK